MKRKKSPCIGVCEFSGRNGWCTGCGLSLEEAHKWKKLKPYDKKALEKKLKKRLSSLENWANFNVSSTLFACIVCLSVNSNQKTTQSHRNE